MKDIISMWKYPKMITITAFCAALYAALLIPFKAVVVPPGVEVRVATVIVPAMGILFGPAGAWGAMIGNIIGDFFGSMSIASIFGAIANFCFAYVPYKIWYSGKDNYPKTNTVAKVAKYLWGSAAGTFADVFFLCFGVSGVFSMLPYSVFFTILFVTNGLVPFVLGAPLISIFTPRIDKWGLLFTDIMKPEDVKPKGKLNLLGAILATVSPALAIGISLILGKTAGLEVGSTLALVNLPFALLTIAGLAMIGMDAKDFRVD